MQRVDEQPNIEHIDKVHRWRVSQLQRFFPGMAIEEAEEIAEKGGPYMLETAERLAGEGCPHTLAYRILR